MSYQKGKFDFGGELTREAIGELGIGDDSVFWDYYGVTVMGHVGEDNQQRIWFHFNVLAERQCMETFNQIIEHKSNAAESFESETVYGYALKIYDNYKQYFKACWLDIVRFFVDKKDLLTFLFILFVCFLGKNDMEAFWSDDENVVTLIFVVLMVVLYTAQAVTYLKNRKYCRKINIVASEKQINIEWYHDFFIKKQMKKIDSIFILHSTLRLEKVFRQSE